VGDFETILHTTDGGKTWNVSHGGNTGDYTVGPSFWIVFNDLQHALVTGLNGEALTTADSGKTWSPEAARAGGDLRGGRGGRAALAGR
jgi:photosystem II stability/assembly factor-like uncharacterized protein